MGACRHFLDCLRRGVPAETRGADRLRTYALVDAAYRARGRTPCGRAGEVEAGHAGRRPLTTVAQPSTEERPAAPSANAFAITVSFELVEGAAEKFHRLVARECAPVGQRWSPAACASTCSSRPAAQWAATFFSMRSTPTRASFDVHLASPPFQKLRRRAAHSCPQEDGECLHRRP